MKLKTSQSLPSGELFELRNDGPTKVNVLETLKDKKVVIFGVPGAYTPTCSETHLPDYVKLHNDFKDKGVSELWCFAVNDPFVMSAWAKEHGSEEKVRMLSDNLASYTKSLGIELDLSELGLGIRNRRFAAVIDNGVVTYAFVEEGGDLTKSAAQEVLNHC